MTNPKDLKAYSSKPEPEYRPDRRAVLRGAAAVLAAPMVISTPMGRSLAADVPMSWAEWAGYDATGLARLLAAGEITPAEAATQAARAVELIDPKVNGVVEVFDDVVADPLKNGMNRSGPFRGVPIFMKDAGSNPGLATSVVCTLTMPSFRPVAEHLSIPTSRPNELEMSALDRLADLTRLLRDGSFITDPTRSFALSIAPLTTVRSVRLPLACGT